MNTVHRHGGWIAAAAGQACTFAIGIVAKDGNRSFIEAGFTTARAR